MKRLVLAACASLCLAAAPAFAADQPSSVPAPTPVTAQPSPHALELAHRYVNDMHFDRVMDSMVDNMIPVVMDQMEKSNGAAEASIPPEFKAAIIDVVRDWSHEETPKMMDRMAVLSAQIYTEQELTDIVAFYESPTGRAVVEKAPLFAAHSGDMFKSMHVLTGPEVLERVCKKVDCAKLLAPKPELKDEHKKS